MQVNELARKAFAAWSRTMCGDAGMRPIYWSEEGCIEQRAWISAVEAVIADLRIRELESELQVRDNMGDEVLRILREATGKRDFHSEMEAAEWAARMVIDLQTQLFMSQQSAKEAMDREAAAVSREIGVRAELADARLDSARLDFLESQCKFQMSVPQFWRNRNGKISFAPFDEAKLVEADNVRAAIDAAMKVSQ